MRTKFFGVTNRNKFLNELEKVLDAKFSDKEIVDKVIESIGEVGGIATLDDSGKVPSEQLPSYVDDIIEYDTYEDLPTPGEGGKIYVTTDNNLQYRWSGSTYVGINEDCIKGDGIKDIVKLTLEEYNNISEKDTRTIYIVETTVEQHINYKVYLGTILLVDSDLPNEIEQLLASI